MDNSEFLWRAFSVTGDPLAYVEYSRNRNEKTGSKGRINENHKSTRLGS
ncbi:MAG: hypothetical protein FWF81_02000 [Defluviitaleaceae bacterium]|nr:hypothetical protein [Defluviitaleaceae bacterium]